jgi:hypothetical protein
MTLLAIRLRLKNAIENSVDAGFASFAGNMESTWRCRREQNQPGVQWLFDILLTKGSA